ncbi:MAG: hypothetical protein LBI04_07785, partial [Treponema sp.]|nr:hypothetical protein [Treponema sp.]
MNKKIIGQWNKNRAKVCFRRDKLGRPTKDLSYILGLLGIVVCSTILNAQTLEQISLPYIMGVSAPVFGATPSMVIIENTQFSGSIKWSPEVLGAFAEDTEYTATITLAANRGCTFQGVPANFFIVDGAASVRNNANSGVVTVVFPRTDTSGTAVSIADIRGITVPSPGGTPARIITETAQYSGTVSWTPEVSGNFVEDTEYTATITLAAKTGYKFHGLAANFFKVAGASSVRSNTNSGIITAVFPAAVMKTITIAAISGVTVPVTGGRPAITIENAQYSGTVTWSPAVSGNFDGSTAYTATITLTAKTGYTLQETAANFFTVAGATSVRGDAGSGIVTAVFPSTKEKKSVYPEDKKLWSIGASVGTSFAAPLLIGTVHGTLAPFKSSFFELGVDAGYGI